MKRQLNLCCVTCSRGSKISHDPEDRQDDYVLSRNYRPAEKNRLYRELKRRICH